jgi:hypothetical protein
MSEDTTDKLLAELQAQPGQPVTRGPVGDAVAVARLVAEIANILVKVLPDDGKLAGPLRKLLDTRTELLGALAERGG